MNRVGLDDDDHHHLHIIAHVGSGGWIEIGMEVGRG